MAYICRNPEQYKGKVVGTGQCVDFVRTAAHAPPHGSWKEGVKVKGANIQKGTAIATFVNHVYPSHLSGNHAAIYIRQDAIAIYVWDQWANKHGVQPVHERPIRFLGGPSLSNDGNAFSVIE